MRCERCGLDISAIKFDFVRYCVRCGERLERKDTEVKALLKVEDVCRMLRLSKGSLYQYVSKGKIPALHVGRGLRFDPELIEKLKKINGSGKNE